MDEVRSKELVVIGRGSFFAEQSSILVGVDVHVDKIRCKPQFSVPFISSAGQDRVRVYASGGSLPTSVDS